MGVGASLQVVACRIEDRASCRLVPAENSGERELELAFASQQ